MPANLAILIAVSRAEDGMPANPAILSAVSRAEDGMPANPAILSAVSRAEDGMPANPAILSGVSRAGDGVPANPAGAWDFVRIPSIMVSAMLGLLKLRDELGSGDLHRQFGIIYHLSFHFNDGIICYWIIKVEVLS